MDLDEETEAPQWLFKVAAVLCVLFAGLAIAFAFMPARQLEPSATLSFDRPQLVVFESASCVWCKRFRSDIAPAYALSHMDGKAPLRYVDISKQRSAGYRLVRRVFSTPTFVLVDTRGRELSRMGNVTLDKVEFQRLVEKMLSQHEASATS